MKKLTPVLMLAAGLLLFTAASSQAQIYVSVRPAPPVIVRTKTPGPKYVWISEDWTVRDGAYVHTGGHWALPPHPGWVWISGHWVHEKKGEIWKAGHWAK